MNNKIIKLAAVSLMAIGLASCARGNSLSWDEGEAYAHIDASKGCTHIIVGKCESVGDGLIRLEDPDGNHYITSPLNVVIFDEPLHYTAYDVCPVCKEQLKWASR